MRRYLIHALEICLVTDQKMSELKAEEFAEITATLQGLYLLQDNDNSM